MTTNVLIGISAGLAALAVLCTILLVLQRRAERSADERVAAAVASLNARMAELRRELAVAVERAEDERRRSRVLGELVGSIDLDEVLARIVEAAGKLRGVDAALVMLPDPHDPYNGKPVVATLGLSLEEAERHATTRPPDGDPGRSVTVSYTHPEIERDAEGTGRVIHHGLAVSLPGEGPSGYLTVFTRTQGRPFDEEDVRELEALALRAAPVIENARRFREARRLADLDALTGLHNRRFFHETLAREIARAHRYERRLALIVFDLDDFKEVNDRIGHLAGDAVLAEAAQRVREVVRSADIACRVGGDEFAVILPESTIEDADQLYRRIQHNVSARPVSQGGKLYLSAGVAEVRSDDDAVTFFKRADDALYRAKAAGKGRVVAATAPGLGPA